MPSSDTWVMDFVFGEDDETYAHGFGSGHSADFRFVLNRSKPPSALENRVVRGFNREDQTEEDSDGQEPSLPVDRVELDDDITEAVGRVWRECVRDPAISKPGTVFDLASDETSPNGFSWKATSHPWLAQYLEILADESLGSWDIAPGTRTIPFESLICKEQLGGGSCAIKVNLPDGSDHPLLFKGVDFTSVLLRADNEGSAALRHVVRGMHINDRVLRRMPPHRNILAPPLAVVTVGEGTLETPLICGTLFPFYAGGDAWSRVEETSELLPLALKARWCADMAAAVAHAHRVAGTYHMDLKPSNFLVDDEQRLLLCDWEQTNCSPGVLAPEADGTWDVSPERDGGGGSRDGYTSPTTLLGITEARPRFRYTKYQGPPRRNVPEDALADLSWHEWNVFPDWKEQCSVAVELAEVFSLGRAMWVLLRQYKRTDVFDVEHPTQQATDWEGCDDVPEAWQRFVDRCMDMDPNARPDVAEVAGFWEAEVLATGWGDKST